jgi:cyclopropane fatty-acyl-phospholipid synthase-like methyltransferase
MNTFNLGILDERLFKSRFPRASAYDLQWLLDNAMAGPPVLCLAEWLAHAMDLRPGMRVLDLGCGRATSSIFLAKEFGVTVWAADLWIKPSENHVLINQVGMSAHVFPLYAEAHALPFADGYFDAIVCVDAYHYFGTDDLYLGTILKFLRPEGRLGIVVPGFLEELGGSPPPPHLTRHWDWEFAAFHSPAWWQRHWQKTGLVTAEVVDLLPDGWKLWLKWNEVLAQSGPERLRRLVVPETEMLRSDDGRTFTIVRMVARRLAG